MAFHSFSFLFLFLPAVVIVHWAFGGRQSPTVRKVWLLCASLVFYSLSGLKTLPILVGSLGWNYWMARRITQAPHGPLRRRRLVAGIVLNVALLVLFKYTGFLAENAGALFGWHPRIPAVALPLGISFFTIQQIIYLVDCYEEMILPAPLLGHATMISLFPCIAAGPILHAGSVLPQLESSRSDDEDRLATGFFRFILGLSKKVVLADPLGVFADAGFTASSSLGTGTAWTTAVAYTLQLYFDFSGYSDMAMGIGLMLGMTLPENFNSPLKARSIIEFWKRWHMTLSGFITTYLYTPMVRALRPVTYSKAMVVTVVAMAIAGIWHGAAWTFLIFGLLHGFGMVVNHGWAKTKMKLPGGLAWALTFVFVVVSFVIFRAENWSQAGRVVGRMFGAGGLGDFEAFAGISRRSYLVLLLAPVIALGVSNSCEYARTFDRSWRWAAICCCLLLLSLLFLNGSATKGFIYRDF